MNVTETIRAVCSRFFANWQRANFATKSKERMRARSSPILKGSIRGQTVRAKLGTSSAKTTC
jgi:hypothetical protein